MLISFAQTMGRRPCTISHQASAWGDTVVGRFARWHGGVPL